MVEIDVRIRQRSMIEFLNGKGETSIRIHGRLKNLHSDAIVDVSTARRWLSETADRLAAVIPHKIQRVDDIILGDRRMVENELRRIFSLKKGSVMTIIQQPRNSKVCAKWVQRMLTNKNKDWRKTAPYNTYSVSIWRKINFRKKL
ncbi:hypothetical protein Trydic_g6050 [Trypoxylus dichotomus]